jgi:hypothetical protein
VLKNKVLPAVQAVYYYCVGTGWWEAAALQLRKAGLHHGQLKGMALHVTVLDGTIEVRSTAFKRSSYRFPTVRCNWFVTATSSQVTHRSAYPARPSSPTTKTEAVLKKNAAAKKGQRFLKALVLIVALLHRMFAFHHRLLLSPYNGR